MASWRTVVLSMLLRCAGIEEQTSVKRAIVHVLGLPT